MLATITRCLFQREDPLVFLERMRCTFVNFSSNDRKNFGFLYIFLSNKMAKSSSSKLILMEEYVFRNSCTSISTNNDTKYSPKGLHLTVAFKVRPFTSWLLANQTRPSLGTLILFPTTAMFSFVSSPFQYVSIIKKNIHSVGSQMMMTNCPVTFCICRLIKIASYAPFSEANSSSTYSLRCGPSRFLMKETSWLKW